MKKLIISLVVVAILFSLFGGNMAGAEDSVPVSKYKAVVRENEALRAKLDFQTKNEDSRVQAAISYYSEKGWAQGVKDTLEAANNWAKDQQIAYDTLIAGIEDLSLSGRQLNIGRSLKPVLFIPADLNPSQTDIDKDLIAIKRSLKLAQIWYQDQLSITFSLEDPIVFKASRRTMDYEAISEESGRWFNHIAEELNLLTSYSGKSFIAFTYGSTDKASRGASWSDGKIIMGGAAINDYTRTLLRTNRLEGWLANAVIVHEIGHIYGLLHNTDTKKIMTDTTLTFQHLFFLPAFTEQEKNIVRKNLAK